MKRQSVGGREWALIDFVRRKVWLSTYHQQKKENAMFLYGVLSAWFGQLRIILVLKIRG